MVDDCAIDLPLGLLPNKTDGFSFPSSFISELFFFFVKGRKKGAVNRLLEERLAAGCWLVGSLFLFSFSFSLADIWGYLFWGSQGELGTAPGDPLEGSVRNGSQAAFQLMVNAEQSEHAVVL